MKHSCIMRMLFLTHSRRRSTQLSSLIVSYRPPILLASLHIQILKQLQAGVPTPKNSYEDGE